MTRPDAATGALSALALLETCAAKDVDGTVALLGDHLDDLAELLMGMAKVAAFWRASLAARYGCPEAEINDLTRIFLLAEQAGAVQ